jgi:hypothetical protein
LSPPRAAAISATLFEAYLPQPSPQFDNAIAVCPAQYSEYLRKAPTINLYEISRLSAARAS